jgi:hypothetical protein
LVSRNDLFPKVSLKRLYAKGNYFAECKRNAWPLIIAIRAVFNKNKIRTVNRLYRVNGKQMAEPTGYYLENWRGSHQIFVNPKKISSWLSYAIVLLHEFSHHLAQIFLTECSYCPYQADCDGFRATPQTLTRLVEAAIDTLI